MVPRSTEARSSPFQHPSPETSGAGDPRGTQRAPRRFSSQMVVRKQRAELTKLAIKIPIQRRDKQVGIGLNLHSHTIIGLATN